MIEILSHVALIVVSIGGLYFACEWFLNAVEWLGARLNLGSTAVGSILAAIGTAMPESIVTLMALVFGSASAREGMAVGSALGGPLVVATVASAAAGVTLLISRRRDRQAEDVLVWDGQGALVGGPGLGSPLLPDYVEEDGRGAELDDSGSVTLSATERARIGLGQKWFIATFVATTLLGLVVFPGKWVLGVALFLVYALYFRQELKGEDAVATDEGLDPLRFQRGAAQPAMWAIMVQIVVTLVVMFFASETFVQQIEWAGPALGLSPLVVALLLAPIATELPETLNAVIWARQGKARLALANVTGSMMIQGTIPAGLAMIGSPWLFDFPALLAALSIVGVAVYLFVVYRSGRVSPWQLVGAFGFYLIFAVNLGLSLH